MAVALLAEGVDRNPRQTSGGAGVLESPSSRRAWIEIKLPNVLDDLAYVALLAEGVDRNRIAGQQRSERGRRPPRGGRG